MDDVEMKPKFEDILFLNSIVPRSTLRLASLHKACEEKQSDSNYKKFITELNISKKHLNDKITDEAMEKMIVEDFKGKSYPAFVKYFKSNYQDCLNKSIKNPLKSAEVRIKANQLFAKKSHNVKVHEDIWRLYSQSIAFAPVASKELALAYECRSNFLLHLKLYGDCVKDIDRALANTEFHLLKVKLLCRKMSCFVAMNKNVSEKLVLMSSIKNEIKTISSPLKDERFSKMIVQAEIDASYQPINKTGYVKTYPRPFNSFPDIVFVRNKEIVANRDFVPGEQVAITKPTITSANPDNFYAYCSHCMSFMWAGIPCNNCSLCMYCSEECKKEAWDKYHSFECKILPHINFDDIIYFDLHTSVKVFLMGLREFGSILKLREEIDKLKDNLKSVRNDGMMDSDFLNFYNHPIKCGSLEVLAQVSKNACLLVAYMIETCDLFDRELKLLKGKELSKNKDIVFCGLVMLKLLLLCHSNMNLPEQEYTVKSCSEGKCKQNGNFQRCCRKGKIFHPFQVLFEKSCNPNVAVFWTDNGQTIYMCVQPIKKMEKIVICRSSEFFRSPRDLRDTVFQYQSTHICECDACTKNWPDLTELYKKFKQRQSKSEKREIKIVQKYLEKGGSEIDKVFLMNWVIKENELLELVKDVNDVVNVCGQPSFASSFLISALCIAYERLYGTIPLQWYIPKNC